jgi:tetratricopeptide (TPR) repeat protein
MQASPALRRYAICALLIVVLLAYWPVYKNGFVYDDLEYITANSHVQHGLTWDEIKWSLTSLQSSNWHPLTWISHMADCQLYGPNPAGHHITNLIFHLANVLLLFAFLSRTTGAFWPSAFVAAIFGVHPLHVESVAWVAERKDVLSTFFWLLTMLAYVRYSKRSSLGNYGLVVGLFILGLASKPMLVSLPFVLLLMDYWPLERMKKVRIRRLILEKIPLIILSAASSTLTYYAQQKGGALATTELYPMSVRIPNALVAYMGYISKMLWPVRLAAFYPHPGKNLPIWEAAAAGVALILITALALWMARKRPYLAVGWLWYVGTLVPVIGLVQVGNQAMADRYAYIPLIGLFIALAWEMSEFLRGKAAAVGACAVLLIFAVLTRMQLPYWHDDITLYEHAIAVTRDNYVAHVNLGTVLKDQNESIKHYREAITIKPDGFLAYHNLGSVLAEQGKLDEAIPYFRKAIRLHANYFEAYNDLGTALMHKGEYDEAYANMLRAVEVNPEYAQGHVNLGRLLDSLGQPKEAIAHFQDAIALDPEDAQAHYDYGVCLLKLGRNQEAIEQYEDAIGLDPTFASAHLNLAVAYYLVDNCEASWREVHLAQRLGRQFNPEFLQQLSSEMPEPLP